MGRSASIHVNRQKETDRAKKTKNQISNGRSPQVQYALNKNYNESKQQEGTKKEKENDQQKQVINANKTFATS